MTLKFSRNSEVDDLQAQDLSKEPEAVIAYSEMVLTRSEYPVEGFAQKFRVAYRHDSAELVIEYDLPEVSIIPEEAEYRYVKTKDTFESKPRKAIEIK